MSMQNIPTCHIARVFRNKTSRRSSSRLLFNLIYLISHCRSNDLAYLKGDCPPLMLFLCLLRLVTKYFKIVAGWLEYKRVIVAQSPEILFTVSKTVSRIQNSVGLKSNLKLFEERPYGLISTGQWRVSECTEWLKPPAIPSCQQLKGLVNNFIYTNILYTTGQDT